MKKILSVFLVFLTLALAGCSLQTKDASVSVEEENLSFEKISMSDFDMYKTFSEEYPNNFIFSPYSIKACLSILYPVSDSVVKEEMEDVLGFSEGISSLYSSYKDYALNTKGSGIKIADRVFVNKNLSSSLNSGSLGTDIETIKINGKTVSRINSFVSKNTGKKIENFLSSDSISDDPSLILVSALYFEKPFEDFEQDSILWRNDEKFYSSFRGSLDVKSVKELENGFEILRVPYSNYGTDEGKFLRLAASVLGRSPDTFYEDVHSYSLYLLYGTDTESSLSVDDFISSLSSEELFSLLDFSEYEGVEGYSRVDFNVPDFELSSENSVNNVLNSLGLVSPFEKRGTNFEGLGQDLYISDICQGSYIKTDENGSVASAAVSTRMQGVAATADFSIVKKVNVDDVFTFIIKDDTEDLILFMGRVSRPSLME